MTFLEAELASGDRESYSSGGSLEETGASGLCCGCEGKV